MQHHTGRTDDSSPSQHERIIKRERGTVLVVLMIDGSVVGGGHHGNTW